MKTQTIQRTLALMLAALMLVGAVDAPSLTGQILAYQGGYIFFTTGDGFHVSPTVEILDDKTREKSTRMPAVRAFARAIFNTAGQVVEIDLSKAPLPIEPLPDDIAPFAVTASSPYPNPDLAAPGANSTIPGMHSFSGKLVLLTITVQIPPQTPPGAQVFITTDQSSWNPEEIQMTRIDALHFRVVRRIASGTILHYLYTRGSLQTEERGENGLDRDPHQLIVTDADVRSINDVVYNWADLLPGNNSQQIQPGVIPTPYNPAPFPNLPQGFPTPHPRQ